MSGPAGDVVLPPLDQLFRAVRGCSRVGLAVSGGGDSTALMLLYRRWRDGDPTAPPARVLTVDHGLRPGAAAETLAVQARAAAWGFAASRLIVREAAPRSDLQAWARDARYRLLAEAGAAHGLDAVLTAHTEDDQAETVLMRLARGSGLRGIAAMHPVSQHGGLRLIRPLLAVSRETLRAVLDAAGVDWAEDPSNDDRRYGRVRWRALLPLLAQEGLTARRLSETAGRLARASAAIDQMVARLAEEAGVFYPAGFARLGADALAAAPREVALRLLADTLGWVNGRPYGPRLDSLESAIDGVLGAAPAQRTIAGAVVCPSHPYIWVYRESGRDGLETIPLQTGRPVVWDRRFEVALEHGGQGGMGGQTDVAFAVGPAGSPPAGAILPEGLPRQAAATAPALFAHGERVAIPGLGVCDRSRFAGPLTVRLIKTPPGPAAAVPALPADAVTMQSVAPLGAMQQW